ncbi:hypothetical protein [Endozoicomonas elysicola]|uniref:hypothetical protein n=1 Tax=Endozoicomonas elysicola TaxID=305900 RepID=UPI001F316C40|nr:hypothetical protein [Endozoicomonas elysicola]
MPSLSETETSNPHKVFGYHDEELLRSILFESIELTIIPYNTRVDDYRQEVLFFPINGGNPFAESPIDKKPFQVEFNIKGEKDRYLFYPYSTALNSAHFPELVRFQEYDHAQDCTRFAKPWSDIATEQPVMVKDRNIEYKHCYKTSGLYYLMIFDVVTPAPDQIFSVDMVFFDRFEKREISQKVFFRGVRVESVSTH